MFSNRAARFGEVCVDLNLKRFGPIRAPRCSHPLTGRGSFITTDNRVGPRYLNKRGGKSTSCANDNSKKVVSTTTVAENS